jgi:hypothetical protein
VRKQGERGGPPSTIEMPFGLESPFISECPASAVTQESIDLVQIVGSLIASNSAAGVTAGAMELPGAVLDALRICQSETRAVESAQEDAVANA